jgi:hypothetical protein
MSVRQQFRIVVPEEADLRTQQIVYDFFDHGRLTAWRG